MPNSSHTHVWDWSSNTEWYTTSCRSEPTSGTYYVSPRQYDKSYIYYIFDEAAEQKKRKLTDIIGEPDWVV